MYKIYQIINIDGERYVGSTKQILKRRYNLHKANNKLKNPTGWTTAKKVMDKPHTILLIENTTEEQVKQRERYWIDKIDCVNIIKLNIDPKECKRIWREKNPDYNKEYKMRSNIKE